MTGKLKYLAAVLLGLSSALAFSQNSQVLYYMNLPQRHLLNPAFTPTNSVYIGLPALSGINFNLNNNFVNFSDVFMKSPVGDSLISVLHPDFDKGSFLDMINDRNSLEVQSLVQLFGLGFRAGSKLYINFDINERIESNIVMPGDIIRLGLEGNEQFAGDRLDLSSLRGDLKYYREIGLGASAGLTDKLRVGARLKLLQGIASASIDNRALGISVDEFYAHSIDADLSLNISAPVEAYVNSEGGIDSISFDDSGFEETSDIINYLLKPGNSGLGLDLGAEYRFSDKLSVSAAITDLGYIRWKRDVLNMEAKSSFTFNGIDLADLYERDLSPDSLFAELGDSLLNSFKINDTKVPFTTYSPFGLTLGGSFNVTKSLSLGLLSYTRFIGKQVREALTLSANLNLGSAFSTTFAYTAANQRYDNLGAGLAFRPGFFQFYFLADRIPVTWNKIKTDDFSIPLPSSWNTIHLRFGMNLVFGNKVKKKNDKPMVIVE
jgi:hypothetical protein